MRWKKLQTQCRVDVVIPRRQSEEEEFTSTMWTHQCSKFSNPLQFSPSCLTCVRSEKLYTFWLSFACVAFDFTLSFLSPTRLRLSSCLLSFSASLAHSSFSSPDVNIETSLFFAHLKKKLGGFALLSLLIFLMHKYLPVLLFLSCSLSILHFFALYSFAALN